jgi:predicted nucleic acid-binding Zn ribbon protein
VQKPKNYCPWCRKTIPKGTRKKYCNTTCKEKYQEHSPNKKRNKPRGKRTTYFSKTEGKVIQFRSLWERDVAIWLDLKKQAWRYEPKYFKLSNGKKYLPDFYVQTDTENDQWEWWEVKGIATTLFIEKYALFCREYPNEKIQILDRTRIWEIRKQLRQWNPNYDTAL